MNREQTIKKHIATRVCAAVMGLTTLVLTTPVSAAQTALLSCDWKRTVWIIKPGTPAEYRHDQFSGNVAVDFDNKKVHLEPILTRLPSDRRGVFSCGWMEAYLVGLRGSLLESVARLTPKTSKRIDERYRCIAVDGGGLRSSLQGQALDMGALRARWVQGPVDDRSPR